MPTLKAVIFDVDDTLIDWRGFNGDWSAAETRHLGGVFAYICEQHPLDDFEAYVTEFRNHTLNAWVASRQDLRAPNMGNVLVQAAEALGVPPGTLDREQCLAAYQWQAVAGTQLFPEVLEVLAELRRHRVPLGIITNAYQSMTMRRVELAQLGLEVDDFFPTCQFSAADFGYLKPHPSIFEAALECMGGIRPEEAVYVGDDLRADVGGSNRVGIFSVLRNARPDQEAPSKPVKPDAVIETLHDLLPVLDRQFPGWRA